jgi:hypothetical protein
MKYGSLNLLEPSGPVKACNELRHYATSLKVRDRSPVVSLGIFSVASDNSICPGSTQPLKMSTRILLGVKAAGA